MKEESLTSGDGSCQVLTIERSAIEIIRNHQKSSEIIRNHPVM
ncbi:MAG: hypothetical protein WBA13_19640 [Microcoleaceae cyanobacterium]